MPDFAPWKCAFIKFTYAITSGGPKPPIQQLL